MEIKKLEKYLIKKEKTDMLSSLKKVNKILSSTKDDIFTQMFFQRLVNNENSMVFSAYEQDVECFNVFAYENGKYYSYYIPDEIKEIIKEELGF